MKLFELDKAKRLADSLKATTAERDSTKPGAVVTITIHRGEGRTGSQTTTVLDALASGYLGMLADYKVALAKDALKALGVEIDD